MKNLNPEKDWKLLILSVIGASLLAIVIDALLFLTLDFEKDPDSNQAAETLDLEAVRATTLYYKSKEALGRRILNGGVPPPPDPSL